MPQGMQAGVFRFALIVHNTRRNHRRPHVTAHDVGVTQIVFGNTKPSSPFGQASRHSFSVFTTSGPTGMTRSPGHWGPPGCLW